MLRMRAACEWLPNRPSGPEAAAEPVAAPVAPAPPAPAAAFTPLEQQMRMLMGDAPFCDVCGHITVRNGTCYKCLNCGNTMGCS